MEHDEKYYRRLAALTRFAFQSVMLVAIVVTIGLTMIQLFNQYSKTVTIPSGRRIFAIIIFAILVVLSRVPDLLSELRRIDLGDSKQREAKNTTPPYAKELEHARKEGLIDQDNRLLKPRSDFVRFCIDYMYFYPYGRPEWKILDNVLKDADGEPISSEKLAQTFQDIKTREGI